MTDKAVDDGQVNDRSARPISWTHYIIMIVVIVAVLAVMASFAYQSGHHPVNMRPSHTL